MTAYNTHEAEGLHILWVGRAACWFVWLAGWLVGCLLSVIVNKMNQISFSLCGCVLMCLFLDKCLCAPANLRKEKEKLIIYLYVTYYVSLSSTLPRLTTVSCTLHMCGYPVSRQTANCRPACSLTSKPFIPPFRQSDILTF